MQTSIMTIGITVLLSLLTSQSYAQGGAAPYLTGTYQVTGPTNEIGDKNTVIFTKHGIVYLIQNSMDKELQCKGVSQLQNGVLKVFGVCSDSSKLEMAIDLTAVTNPGYFRAHVLSKTIYPKAVQMEFLQR
ncbi:hypothetical protein ACLVWU_00485 [Bdellovibrio sp. HCB290]|uniref:hypothetical protein n=1 Tax=Bdellovibrio sp. HCB290 TaxID=3394356 RepID=UPI0039B4EB68